MDIAIALIAIVVSVLTLFSGDVLGWIAREIRLMCAKSWEPLAENKADSPAVQKTMARLAQAKVNMRARGTPLLADGRKGFYPVNPMAKSQPKPTNVAPLRRRPH